MLLEIKRKDKDMNEFESFVDLTLGLETDEELWNYIEELVNCGSITAELIA